MNDKYYSLYMKYKLKYLTLKDNKQKGAGVIFSPMYDDYVGDNALKEIIIRAVKFKSKNDIIYDKIIQVEAGFETGTIYYYDHDTGKSRKYSVNRGQIEELLDNIRDIWDLPESNNKAYDSEYSVYVKHGDDIWQNDISSEQKRFIPITNLQPVELTQKEQALRITLDQEDEYNDIVSNILGFE